MRRFVFASLALALAGVSCVTHALAQEKVAPPTKVEAKTVEACAQPCLEKVCIAVPDKKKISKVEYACKEQDICLPKCPKHGFSFKGLFHRHCEACDNGACPAEGCAKCGNPRTVRVLMKRTVTTECPTTKCEVVHQEVAPKVCTTAAKTCNDPCPPAATTTPAAPAPMTMPRATEARPLPAGTTPARSVEPVR